jgi:outer membrane immunogenic protein
MYRYKAVALASTALCVGLGISETATAQSRGPMATYFTGFYAGGNAGYSWGHADVATTVSPFTSPNAFDFPGGTTTSTLRPNGPIGGVQIGYNWRVAPHWLVGIEADIQASAQSDFNRGYFSGIGTCGGTGGVCTFTNTTDITAKLSWFGTVRGRAGFEWNNVWWYATGGLAYGQVSVSGTNTLALTTVGTVTYLTPFSYAETKTGYVWGFGSEAVLDKNWSWKLEYIHIDLGSIGGRSFGSAPVVTLNTRKFTDEIVRVGLNYKFAATPSP